ncbi:MULTISPECIES: restriction endonuclease subunit S [Enterobacter cloacae complex]|uniref:restriction endonuclease subunit S n=1 Tax=Enterobacter cloacae complex TaxID=354276 RepID=UPI001BD5A2B7|nr:restriction endonuclease subunit S [Enterobacter cloacae]EHN8792537.1 restriction endonuclease subunit S [Enterobacter kobei]EHN8794723.1 restriction endonuclease subunit S [Enterobacter kobei]MDR9971771.1 restriction endonuclease subunit S [Enterobacter cloacae subsp. cloacae]MDS0086216.1 restriction endonuclease subunit S [Enterobacter cloacae subsp. cloacae]HCL6101063.1 restriction endonuclease subunit S [Enterobacter cloacae]
MNGPLVKLGDVLSIIRGITFKPNDQVEPFSEGSTIVMRTKNVQRSGLDISDLIAIPNSFIKRDEQYLRSEDMLISSANSWELVGKISFIEKLPANSTAGGFISIIRAKKEKVIPKYLYYWLTLEHTQVKIRNCGQKTTNISNLNLERFKELLIPLPSLNDQRRIVSILDKAAGIRQKREQAIKLADDFLRATFLEMFGDPVKNPKGWNVKPLADQIAHANNGISRRRKEDANEGDIVLRLQDVHYSGIAFNKQLNRIKLGDKEKQIARVEYDDLLFIRVNGNPNYVGRTAVFKSYLEPVYHNDHLIRIKLNNEYHSDFLCYLINSPLSRKIISRQIKTSAGQHTISQDGILKLVFYRPPVETQEKFIKIKNKIEAIFYRKDKHEDLFASISNKLLHSIK